MGRRNDVRWQQLGRPRLKKPAFNISSRVLMRFVVYLRAGDAAPTRMTSTAPPCSERHFCSGRDAGSPGAPAQIRTCRIGA
jgi:hypothetical protein